MSGFSMKKASMNVTNSVAELEDALIIMYDTPSTTKMKTSVQSKQSAPSFRLSVDWDKIFRKTSADIKKQEMYIVLNRSREDFCTGSSYMGQWNAVGMDGYGSYIFPHGCEYQGGFEDGRFHGTGTISYPIGQKIDGTWFKGQLLSFKFCNIDGLDNTESKCYCEMPDRRFLVSKREGLLPAGRERKTNQQPTRRFPWVYGYDTADGFFDPITKTILAVRDPDDYANLDLRESVEVIQNDEDDNLFTDAHTVISDRKAKWIKEHCRKGWDEPAGHRPDVFEHWTTGRRKECEEIDKQYDDPSIEDEFGITMKRLSLIDNIQRLPMKYSGTGRRLLPKIT